MAKASRIRKGRRKPYQKPTLERYGNLRMITTLN